MVVWGSCVLGLFHLGVFFRWLTRVRTLWRSLFGHTLIERRGGGVIVPRPTGLLTARVLVKGGSALPRVSTCLLVPRQSLPEIAHLLSHRLVSAETHALTATRPLGHSLVFPHLDVRSVYLVDSFIARGPQYNTHTTSLIPTLLDHTFSDYLTVPILTVEGRRQAFTSFLVHTFNWLASRCHGVSTDSGTH